MDIPMTRNTCFSILKPAFAALAMASLSGCASLILGSGDVPPRYTLQPVAISTETVDPLRVRLVVTDPQSEAAFDTSRISFSPEPLRYEYYVDGEWTDQLPLLFGIFLQRNFENDGRVATVGDRVSVPLGDYVLRTDIRAFHVQRRGESRTAVVSYSAKLFNSRNDAIATRIFSTSEPVPEQGLDGAVEALNLAARRSAMETIDWTLELMRQNPVPTN
ncbi:hypothetical protein GCM10011342_08210 [Aquisalinus flavus]|uniref:ABC-type transport auxiliary lipoprotein component domain-containing protein n=2 Tax=Aquisalinus flavus TaxID=1526572 RepID=A0A8J2Y3A7_9PROT|nr:hypothetical protein GCM10011342_08210 [Aquisalinus flavus]